MDANQIFALCSCGFSLLSLALCIRNYFAMQRHMREWKEKYEAVQQELRHLEDGLYAFKYGRDWP